MPVSWKQITIVGIDFTKLQSGYDLTYSNNTINYINTVTNKIDYSDIINYYFNTGNIDPIIQGPDMPFSRTIY